MQGHIQTGSIQGTEGGSRCLATLQLATLFVSLSACLFACLIVSQFFGYNAYVCVGAISLSYFPYRATFPTERQRHFLASLFASQSASLSACLAVCLIAYRLRSMSVVICDRASNIHLSSTFQTLEPTRLSTNLFHSLPVWLFVYQIVTFSS